MADQSNEKHKSARAARMSIPVTAKQRDWLRAVAKREMRTMTSHVRWLIQRAMVEEIENDESANDDVKDYFRREL